MIYAVCVEERGKERGFEKPNRKVQRTGETKGIAEGGMAKAEEFRKGGRTDFSDTDSFKRLKLNFCVNEWFECLSSCFLLHPEKSRQRCKL